MELDPQRTIQDDAANQLRRATGREWVLRALILASALALVGSLIYQGAPPDDFVHTHQSFRIYAPVDGQPQAIHFPIFNYEARHPFVHMHDDDPHLGDRSNELFHVHKAGFTLGDFLGSLALTIEPGFLQLDSPDTSRKATHHGESWADNATHQWRLYIQPVNQTWQRVMEPSVGGSVDFGARPFGEGERILLTYLPRAMADDDPVVLAQKDSVAGDLWRWPQDGPGDRVTPGH